MDDGSDFPESYAVWLQQAERDVRLVEDGPCTAYRTHIDPEAFLAWCEKTGMRPDAEARLIYVDRVARQTFRKVS